MHTSALSFNHLHSHGQCEEDPEGQTPQRKRTSDFDPQQASRLWHAIQQFAQACLP